jgi:hypothetical protein
LFWFRLNTDLLAIKEFPAACRSDIETVSKAAAVTYPRVACFRVDMVYTRAKGICFLLREDVGKPNELTCGGLIVLANLSSEVGFWASVDPSVQWVERLRCESKK